MTPVLVGECSPGAWSALGALDLAHHNGSGVRLARILGLRPASYLALRRVNLLVGPWDQSRARFAAVALWIEQGTGFILLGRRVAGAFGEAIEGWRWPLLRRPCERVVVLPHFSEVCRAWNDPATAVRARALMTEAFLGIPVGEALDELA